MSKINRQHLSRLVEAKVLSPQTHAIATHLLETGNISGIEASAMFKCRYLPRRILDLREAGVDISSVRKIDTTGQRYVRYVLN